MSQHPPQTNVYVTYNDLAEATRVETIQLLNQALADATDLQSQAKFAHWNVKGFDFYQLHLLFDELAETLSEHVDVLAERATALGGQAIGTTRVAAETSRIPEPPLNAVREEAYLDWLATHVGQHASYLRAGIERAADLGDEDTADLLTELSREVDKHLYFLESHLQSQVETTAPAVAPSGATVQAAARQPASREHGRAPAHEAASEVVGQGPQAGPTGQQGGSGATRPMVRGGAPTDGAPPRGQQTGHPTAGPEGSRPHPSEESPRR
jgi:starvation-inducible DNA-binding protein